MSNNPNYILHKKIDGEILIKQIFTGTNIIWVSSNCKYSSITDKAFILNRFELIEYLYTQWKFSNESYKPQLWTAFKMVLKYR